MSILDRIQTKQLYEPTAEDCGGLKDIPTTEIWLQSADGNRINGAYYRGTSQSTILFAHGRNRNITRFGEHYKLFVRLGISFLTFDYPGFGKSTGSPNEQGTYDAAEAALAYLVTEAKTPIETIMLYGLSLGSGVAIELAARHPKLKGIIAEGSFSSTRAMARFILPYLPIWPLVRDRYRSTEKVSALHMPKLFVHAGKDLRIPLRHSEELYQRAADPKFLVVVPGAGHKNLVGAGGETYQGIIKDFVDNLSVSVPNWIRPVPIG